jgi:bacteriophage exclusion system BrxA-like protein
MGESRQYTTQLGAGLGMIQETFDLLRLWQPGDTPKQLSDKAIRTGAFSRATARRTRNIVIEMFAPRFLPEGGKGAAYLKRLIESNIPAEDLTQLLFLYTARAQLVFADFVTDVYWPRYRTGATCLGRAEAETFIHRALDSGWMQKRWAESMVKRVAGYLIGCCVDFGLLSDRGRSARAMKHFSIRPRVALYLAHDLHFSGLTDFGLTRHSQWRLFGFDPQEVVNQIKELAHDGHLIVQAAADLVHIAWRYRSMEECNDAIAQRQI